MAWLTVGEAAERLRVSESTVYAMASDGRLPRLAGLRHVRIPSAAIDMLEAEALEVERDRYLYLRARSHGAVQHAKPGPTPRFWKGVLIGAPLSGLLWFGLCLLFVGFWFGFSAIEQFVKSLLRGVGVEL